MKWLKKNYQWLLSLIFGGGGIGVAIVTWMLTRPPAKPAETSALGNANSGSVVANGSNINQTVVMGSVQQPEPTEPPSTSARKAFDATHPRSVSTPAQPGAVPQSVGTVNQGPGSAFSINQQGGITAGTVNIDPRPHIALTDAQAAIITEALKPFAGRHAIILAHGGTQEQVAFGKKLTAALDAAGVQTDFGTGMAFSEAGDALPWLFIGWGEHNKDMANALVGAIRNSGAIPMAHVGVHYYDNADADKNGFQIILGQPQ